MRRDKRHSLRLLGGAFAAAALPASAQARMPRIGYLLLNPMSESPTRERQAFLDGLREHGYVPGKNIEIVYRSAQNAEDFMDDVAQELVAEKVDLIVVSGALATLAAKKATSSIPIVIQALGDPVGAGAVRSLSRPEGNVTGVSFLSTELAGKRIQLIKDLVPAAKRIAVLWDERNSNSRAESAATVEAAKGIGLRVEPIEVHADADLRRRLGELRTSRPDALYVVFEGGLVANNRTYLAQFALQERIPLVSGWSFVTEAGGLVSYAPDIPAMFRRSASYVDRILKGAKPRDLPIEQAQRVELVVNVRTAKALGITLPQSVLVRADRVLE
jgi:putative ABC transport system substrate-binding protein